MTHGTLIWHRCFCSYCSPSPSPSPKHDTSFSLYTFFLSFFLPPKRSIPRSFPSPFLRRILSNLSLSLAASPSPSAREWKRALDRCLLSPPVSTRHEGWFSRATRNNYATKEDTHPNATCRGMHFNALQADKMRRGMTVRISRWPRLVNERCSIYFISTRYYIFFPNVSDFSLACQRIFYLFLRGENWGGEKRRDGKVPLSREGSRRLELNSFRSVVTIKWRDVQWYANNGGKERGS